MTLSWDISMSGRQYYMKKKKKKNEIHKINLLFYMVLSRLLGVTHRDLRNNANKKRWKYKTFEILTVPWQHFFFLSPQNVGYRNLFK
jgi:hypothetical protein